jgi:hypothetical protein
MRMPLHIPVPARCAACALALTLAACPDGTGPSPVATFISFDEFAENTRVGEQYGAVGVEFVTGPLFAGIPRGALPVVVRTPFAAEAPNQVAFIHSLTPLIENYDPNVLWCRLAFPAKRVQVRVGVLQGEAVAIRLVTQDAHGNQRTVEKTVSNAAGMSTLLTIEADGPEITSFAVYAPNGLVVVDDVRLVDYR